ncbi:hypothetical protein [Bradyrhizobium embrapense]|uniref:hypothetical protein n=1 Tax=Bradyrhizobium embrapense TaxID=630921 RepID=UPI000AB142B0|nr:hypothetical protein [Bradyrhizobium embrapense]
MPKHPLPFVFDLQAVRLWSEASGNEAQIVLGDLEDEQVLIFNRVLNEFAKAYPDSAVLVKAHDFPKKRVTEEHRMSAAALAESSNATFGRKGPYDQCIEWCVAGIACCGPYTIVTDDRRKSLYQKVNGLSVITFEEYLNLH